jgi:tripartite-type tricarboxylate transporter receptor subunit TctC
MNPEEKNSSARGGLSRRELVRAAAALSAAGALGLPLSSRAQTSPTAGWPTKSLRIIVPFTPGGSTDHMSRMVAQQLSLQLPHNVVVENKPGAGGTLAAADVARAPADGYTLLATTPTFVITQYVYPKLPYDVRRDFEPIGLMVQTPMLLVVHAGAAAKSPADYIRAAKANPSKITYSSAGVGSIPHLAGEALQRQAGISLTHVPYKGGGDAVIAVLGGHVDSAILHPIDVNTHLKSGKLIAIASTSLTRWPGLLDLPTLAESGVPDYEVMHFTGLVVRRGTPAEIVTRLSDELQTGLKAADMRRRIGEFGAVPAGTIAEAAERLEREHRLWSRIVKDANVTASS